MMKAKAGDFPSPAGLRKKGLPKVRAAPSRLWRNGERRHQNSLPPEVAGALKDARKKSALAAAEAPRARAVPCRGDRSHPSLDPCASTTRAEGSEKACEISTEFNTGSECDTSLLLLLKDNDYSVRQASAYAWDESASKRRRLVPGLLGLVQARRATAVLSALGDIGTNAETSRPRLIKALQRRNEMSGGENRASVTVLSADSHRRWTCSKGPDSGLGGQDPQVRVAALESLLVIDTRCEEDRESASESDQGFTRGRRPSLPTRSLLSA